MLGCKSRITGHKNHKNYYVRKTVYREMVVDKRQKMVRQNELPEVIVYREYLTYFESGSSYQCPFCKEKIWLGSRAVGRGGVTCPFCSKEFILDVKREW